MSTRTGRVFGAANVVRVILIPLGLAEIARTTTAIARNQPSVRKHRSPFRSHIRRGNRLTQRQHALGHAIQIIRQRRRNVGRIKRRFIRITDDRAVRIVARDDDESTLANVEDKKRLVLACIDKSRFSTLNGELRCGEFLCSSQGRGLVDGGGLQDVQTEHHCCDK